MSDLIVHPIALVGGLEDSKAKPDPGDFQRLENFSVFRGRFALRAPLFLAQETGFLDDQGSPAAITHLLAAASHNNKLFVVGYSSGQQKVYLYECNADGSSPVRVGTFIWSSVVTPPRPVLASFEGGSATSGTKRLYIADYDGQQVTKFWDGTTITTLQVDFDNSGSAEDIKYHFVAPYQFHMWGAGHFQAAVARSEMVRFSRPGLIPEDDPDGQGASLVEWFINDFRPVGRRGDKITNLGFAGGSMIVFKALQTFVLFGYDSQSWAVRLISERAGSVGPYSSASTGDGLCFFWSERGPHVTDGQQVYDISESVRKHVLEAEVSDEVVVFFSPDDGLVYFVYPKGGSTEPDHWLAYDKENKKFSEGEWIRSGGGILQLRHAVAIPSTSLPAPVAAPSALALTVVDENNIDLSWTNGDTALDTKTEVYFGTASPATTQFGVDLASGVSSVRVSGLTAKTTYFFRVRHERNLLFSGYSNEPSAKTKLARPTNLVLTRLSTGIRVSLTNNEAGADVKIERRVSGSPAFEALTTLVAQGGGTITFDNTSNIICGEAYDYRTKATKAAETDSEYSTTATSQACLAPTVTGAAHAANLAANCDFGGSTVFVSWAETNTRPGDTVRISRNDNGAGFVERAVIPKGTGFYNDPWGFKSGATGRTLQYRVELLDGGISVVSTSTSTSSNESVEVCNEV